MTKKKFVLFLFILANLLTIFFTNMTVTKISYFFTYLIFFGMFYIIFNESSNFLFYIIFIIITLIIASILFYSSLFIDSLFRRDFLRIKISNIEKKTDNINFALDNILSNNSISNLDKIECLNNLEKTKEIYFKYYSKDLDIIDSFSLNTDDKNFKIKIISSKEEDLKIHNLKMSTFEISISSNGFDEIPNTEDDIKYIYHFIF